MILEVLAHTVGEVALTVAIKKHKGLRRFVYGSVLMLLAVTIGVAAWS